MLFGSKETFAIEALSEPDLVPPSAVWGRMQVWCEGASLGDIAEQHCALYPAYLGFKALRQSLPSLWLQEFAALSDTELCNHLDGLLFGFHGDVQLEDPRTAEQCRLDWDQYGKFSFLTHWGEQFDGSGKSFILCTPSGTVRVFNRSQAMANRISLQAPLADVLPAVAAYLVWFESEARRLEGVVGVQRGDSAMNPGRDDH